MTLIAKFPNHVVSVRSRCERPQPETLLRNLATCVWQPCWLQHWQAPQVAASSDVEGWSPRDHHEHLGSRSALGFHSYPRLEFGQDARQRSATTWPLSSSMASWASSLGRLPHWALVAPPDHLHSEYFRILVHRGIYRAITKDSSPYHIGQKVVRNLVPELFPG